MTSKSNCVLCGAFIFFQAKVSLLLNLPCNMACLRVGSGVGGNSKGYTVEVWSAYGKSMRAA